MELSYFYVYFCVHVYVSVCLCADMCVICGCQVLYQESSSTVLHHNIFRGLPILTHLSVLESQAHPLARF